MKKLLPLFIFAFSYFNSEAQADATAAGIENIQNAPSFKIFAAPDSAAFTSEQLKKNSPFILIFFNPDCEHCQRETKELLAYKQELRNVQIVMASAASFALIKDFYKDYNIASMPNIVMGQDLNYTLGLKYHLRTYPAIYIYDAERKLAKAFAGNASVPLILEALK